MGTCAVSYRFTASPSLDSPLFLAFKFTPTSKPNIVRLRSNHQNRQISLPRISQDGEFMVVADDLDALLALNSSFARKPSDSFVNCPVSVMWGKCKNPTKSATNSLHLASRLGKETGILPKDLRDNLRNEPRRNRLLEVVMDLGRFPEARFRGECSGQHLRNTKVSREDLDLAQKALGEFQEDNRVGIEGTLHRISAIRNRKGLVVGLTCRVGRSVTGYVDMVRDLLQYRDGILFLGRPGVGKTTVMREIACVLADELHRRVVIVDTSNEIGGDGDIPHAAIGGARRMQVPNPSMQHKIMIEAVENHMPQVIIVDEIGTEAEALACRSIAERGVMLIGTAHGERIENVIKNPILSDLVGGVQTVTLGDDEARARGSQKSILERKASPTFPFLIEMRERDHWVAHRTERSVDTLLHGGKPQVEVRKRDDKFKVVIERWVPYDANEL